MLGCRAYKNFTEQDIRYFLRQRNLSDTAKLLWDGGYCYLDSTRALMGEKEIKKYPNLDTATINARVRKEIKFYLVGNLFFKNGMGYFKEPIDNKRVQEEYTLKDPNLFYSQLSHWGAFNVRKDTVEALIYKLDMNIFKLPRWEQKIVKYRGIIQNDSTIVDWRQVPPYRDIHLPDTMPRILKFVKYPEKKYIDTTRASFYKKFILNEK